jgi:F-type H+-transporting ATPase subunit epsilon
MRQFPLEIVTPDGVMWKGDAESLLVRTHDGDVEILAGHADYIASVATGRARIITGGAERFASTAGGFLSVTREGVKLVAITFEFAENIDLDRAKQARERAEEAISRAKDDRDIALAKAKLKRAISRINIAGMK